MAYLRPSLGRVSHIRWGDNSNALRRTFRIFVPSWSCPPIESHVSEITYNWSKWKWQLPVPKTVGTQILVISRILFYRTLFHAVNGHHISMRPRHKLNSSEPLPHNLSFLSSLASSLASRKARMKHALTVAVLIKLYNIAMAKVISVIEPKASMPVQRDNTDDSITPSPSNINMNRCNCTT